ncbi:LysR family transcriptional regulator [Vibrio sp. M60_M31a]
MSNISIKQLETFRTVMRSGSVTVAAKTLMPHTTSDQCHAGES